MKTVDSIRTKLRKLANTSFSEMRTRGLQEFWKRWYLLQTRSGHSLIEPGEYHSAGNFFFRDDQVESILEALQRNAPDYAACLREYSDAICGHHFDLLGYVGLDYGTKIEWHRDRVSGKSAPVIPWYKINFLDYSEVGDVKVTWELNRHQHLALLARAHRLSGEKRYLRELKSQFYDWVIANPYGIGVNWSSSLEVAFRCLSWLWVRELLPKDDDDSRKFAEDLNCALAVSALHLERYLSTYFSPNTHLIGEGVALFFVGTCCQGPRSAKWQDLGRKIVLSEANRQVLGDGIHFEQSTYYHVYTIDFFLHFHLLANANGIEIPEDFRTTISKMLDVLRTLTDADHPIRFGDDDGGRVFNGRRNKPEHLSDPLATGAVLFDRPDWKLTGAHLSEEAIWLLGADALEQFECQSPMPPRSTQPCCSSSGIFVLRDDAPVANTLTFDAQGPAPFGGGHSHADALNVQFCIQGQNALTDSGTYVYVSNGNDRQIFRSTAAHNTATVDDMDQMVARGPFPWASSAPAETVFDITGSDSRLLRARHYGYSRLNDPVIHERTVFHVSGAFWFIGDAFRGSRQHKISIRWHLAPGLTFRRECFGISSATKDAFLTMAFERDTWSDEIVPGEYSSVYGKKEIREVLCQTAVSQLPLSTGTFIASHAAWPEILTLERLNQPGGQITYNFLSGEKQHQLQLPSPDGQILLGELAGAADFAYVSRDASQQMRVYLYNVSSLRAGNRALLKTETTIACLEVSQDTASPDRQVIAPQAVKINEDLRPWLDSLMTNKSLTTSKGTS